MRGRRLAVFLFGAAISLLSLSCSSPQQRVKKVVLGLERAIEDRNLLKLADYLSPTYKDPYGQGRAETLGYFKWAFEQFDGIDLSLGPFDPKIAEDGQTASLAFNVTVRVKERNSKKVEDQDVHVTLNLRKEDGHWRVISAYPDEPLSYP